MCLPCSSSVWGVSRYCCPCSESRVGIFCWAKATGAWASLTAVAGFGDTWVWGFGSSCFICQYLSLMPRGRAWQRGPGTGWPCWFLAVCPVQGAHLSRPVSCADRRGGSCALPGSALASVKKGLERASRSAWCYLGASQMRAVAPTR